MSLSKYFYLNSLMFHMSLVHGMHFWDNIDGVTHGGPSKEDFWTRKAVLEHLHVNLTPIFCLTLYGNYKAPSGNQIRISTFRLLYTFTHDSSQRLIICNNTIPFLPTDVIVWNVSTSDAYISSPGYQDRNPVSMQRSQWCSGSGTFQK